jgi:hypothetical protein
MRCERAQPLLSARMDGATVSRAASAAVDAHSDGCAACTTFVERSERVRVAVRIRPAMPVPDLVEPIMSAVAAESPVRRRLRPRPRSIVPRSAGDGRRALAAAAVIGLVVGSVAVGGPWRPAAEQPIAIATVAGNVRAAAASLEAYSATYSIVERGLSREVPERRLEVDVAFLDPQRFRMDVRDQTAYPPGWTPTDLTYIEDAPASFTSATVGCVVVGTACPTERTRYESTSTFSAETPLPIDLIVPIATFGSTDGIRVIGTEPLGGRGTVHVAMAFDRATPLFPFLRIGGTWRPFFAGDRVDLWLDGSTSFPVRATITPSTALARDAWETRHSLPPERADVPILEMDALTIRDDPPDGSRFAIPDIADPDVRPASLAARLGYVPVTPAETVGLELVSASIPGGTDGAMPRSLLVYARGLDYLRIAEHPSWGGPGPFGPVGADAEEIALGGGVARFAPADDLYGNRVAIHAEDTDVYLESNLPRADLLAVAGSLPVHGVPLPPSQR